MKQKVALITGITGQDGSYLTDLLLKKNYVVHGIVRRTSTFNTDRIDEYLKNEPYLEEDNDLILHFGDLSDSSSINNIVENIKPDEVYNLGAQSHVQVSFSIPEYTCDIDAIGTLRILEAIKSYCPKAKFYQASSSEMYGKVIETPQNEQTPFYPRSPYGCAKVFSYFITKNYREGYNLFACNGILFNHESPKRGKTFVTRKITRAAARIKLGLQEKLYLGNLNSKRDWGHAKDYVEAMWLMLQQPKPDDFVIATGETHSVKEFVEKSFLNVGIEIVWKGKGILEKGFNKKNNKVLIEIDPKYFRPTEVDLLLGDPSKAKRVLDWKPRYKFNSLIKDMVNFDLKNESKLNGWKTY